MRLEERTITICDEKFLPFATMDYTQSWCPMVEGKRVAR
jgi:hypothetical protein